MRYLITFSCYGHRLHGSELGSVDRHHNALGKPFVEPSGERVVAIQRIMRQPEYLLNETARATVLQTLGEVCSFNRWNLLAAHVRRNHVHVVVEADIAPEKIMNVMKCYATRALKRLGDDEAERRRWARHGSTRWLLDDQRVREAIDYVVEHQGEPMALYVADWYLAQQSPRGIQ